MGNIAHKTIQIISIMKEHIITNAFDLMCKAMTNYRTIVKMALKECGKELPLLDGYGDKGYLEISVAVGDSLADYYMLDRVRYNEKEDYIEFHAMHWNGNVVDYWIPAYQLGSDDTYAMENIIWTDKEE